MMNTIKTMYKQHFYRLCIGIVGLVCTISLFSFWMMQRSPYHQYLRAINVGDRVTAVKFASRVRDANGNTPLHWLGVQKDTDEESLLAAQWLVHVGVDINQKNKRGATPLMGAILGKKFKTSKWLLENGAVLSSPRQSYESYCVLDAALHAGECEIVAQLLKKDIDPNVCDAQYGRNPLYCAIEANNIEMVKVLLQHGANLHHRDKDGVTPLHAAIATNYLHLTQLLLEQGANINAQTLQGLTPLHFAMQYDNEMNLSLIQLLLKKGANANLRDNKYGATALMYAISSEKLNAMKLLINEDKDAANLAMQGDVFPLHMVVYKKNFAMAQLLLQKGANPNPVSAMQTPLCIAVAQNDIVMTKLLLEYGARVKPDAGHSGLTLKQLLGNPKILEESKEQNSEPQTLVEAVQKHQNPEMIALLKQYEK